MSSRFSEFVKEHKLLSGIVGTSIAAATAVGVGIYNHPQEAIAADQDLAPTVSIDRFDWIGSDGRYEVSGTVRDFQPGQMLWTYNQAHDKSDYAIVGPIFPDMGPCPISDNGTFDCALGYALNSPADSGVTYTIYVAMVTAEQAYESARVKASYEALTPFSSVASIPHIVGVATVDSVDRLHPS